MTGKAVVDFEVDQGTKNESANWRMSLFVTPAGRQAGRDTAKDILDYP